jgi:hypothetical protein
MVQVPVGPYRVGFGLLPSLRPRDRGIIKVVKGRVTLVSLPTTDLDREVEGV